MAGLKQPMYEMLPIPIEDNSPAQAVSQDITADFPHLDMCTDLEVSLLDKLPSKRGWLHKKSPSFFKTWQRRYFILYNKKLKYYKNAKEGRYLGIIDFDLVSVQVDSVPRDNPINVVLSIAGHDREFILRASCPTEAVEWTQAILRHILLSEGNRRLLRAVKSDGKFWKYDRVSENQFRDMACTGDLLLFTGKTVASKLQRSFTRSEYDHVAMILRYNSGMLGLLEATDTEVRFI